MLAAAVGFIAPLSLFVHDFMLETLKVPYPETVGVPATIKFLGEAVRLLTLALISRLSRPWLRGVSRAQASVAAALLLTMLYETIRVFLIEGAIVGSELYTIFDTASRTLSLLVGGFAAAWVGFGAQKTRNAALVIILIAACVTLLVHPALDMLCASFKAALPEPTPLYTDPYPFRINVLIYTTFIEPTIAAFVMVRFCWPALGTGNLRRTVMFVVLLLLVRGRFVAFLLESFWVKQPLPTAFLAESQFFLETLALALLVALAWQRFADSAKHRTES